MRRIWIRIAKRIGWLIKDIRRSIRRMSPAQKKMWTMFIVAMLIGGFLGGVIGRSIEKSNSKKAVVAATNEVQKTEKKKQDALKKELFDLQKDIEATTADLPWNMVLVNGAHEMEEGYVPELVELKDGYQVDKRIVDAAKQMLADAKADGMKIVICSAYRSVSRQEEIFNDSMKDRLKSGMGYWDAYVDTSQSVAEPGTSEHALGLALDLISNQYSELDERQEGTKEAKWLEENCHKYGFILRYPPEKTSITGIIYEPWHYRYVGVEHATKITELGVTLEEYLKDYYQPEGEQ